jgi:hypothetical protein
MTEAMTETVVRMQSSKDLRCKIEACVCDQCQGECWTVEVWVYDLLGTDAKACLLYREHIARQSEACSLMARWLIGNASRLSRAETAAWMLEHQQQLW